MEQVLEWEQYEHPVMDKGPEWFWKVSLITAIAAVLSLLFRNILLAILLALGGFALLLHNAKIPRLTKYRLSRHGVQIDRQVFPYDRLNSFWITDEQNGQRKVIIQIRRLILPHLILPLADNLSDRHVRDYLLTKLPEERHEDSFADMLFDSLGF